MKIGVVGAGNVGSTVAFYAALQGLGDIALVDISGDMAAGKALDIQQAVPSLGTEVIVKGGDDYAALRGADIVVITAGVPRKPGMSRDDLVFTNAGIMKSIVPQVMHHTENPILIIVSNPLDVMVHIAHQVSRLPKERVIGMAGVLDTLRFKTFLAKEACCSFSDVDAMVLGSHGDLMVPLISHCTIRNQPLSQVLSTKQIAALVERTQQGGAEIVGLLKTGSAYYAPAVAVLDMVRAIIKDSKEVLPCSVLLEGEYGEEGVFVGVPVRLGKKGVDAIIELSMTDLEKEQFSSCANGVRQMILQLSPD
ncbi:malate dehydrogenase [Candidatus Woesearchaeota archaeon]|nr:malate dehydrogenase [Candidatus Woesearchaeota archaeon]